jgi:hypothetical protein
LLACAARKPKLAPPTTQTNGTHYYRHIIYFTNMDTFPSVYSTSMASMPESSIYLIHSFHLMTNQLRHILGFELSMAFISCLSQQQIEDRFGALQTSPQSIIPKPLKPGKYRIVQNFSSPYTSDSGVRSINADIISSRLQRAIHKISQRTGRINLLGQTTRTS